MGASATVGGQAGRRGPVGYKGPRAAILVELKRERRRTANQLASRLGASLNAVRHHLRELENEALVEYERERRGVGAPVFAYRLTAAGEALFPQRYEATLLMLLDQLVERGGREEAIALLESCFDSIARRLEPELAGATESERLDIVTRALADEGYMAEWEGSDEGGALIEHNCAILAVAQRFPEICGAEERFLSRTLGADVERQSHILTGCNACGYAVRFPRRADTEHT
jgi:DeoR family suf operon transcriptional repressor